MAAKDVAEFTDQNFEAEVLKNSEPVLVDFWAEWCPPCRLMNPEIEKIADGYVGKVKVGKLDTEINREVAMQYSISALPTVLIFKDGQVVQKLVGYRRESDFKEALTTAALG